MSHLFKVGDRVRVVRVDPESKFPHLAGAEGVVFALDVQNARGQPGRIQVTALGDSNWALLPENLVPLNPPKSQTDEILAMRDLPDFEITRVAA